jgi:hypothetical protein
METLLYIYSETQSNKSDTLKNIIINAHLCEYEALKEVLLNNTIDIKIIKSVNKLIKKKIKKHIQLLDIITFFKVANIDLIKYVLIEEYKYNKSDIQEIYDSLNEVVLDDFKWRLNQETAIASSVHTDFVSGIHSQAVGSGKSLIGLKTMWEYHKKNPTHNMMWLCERKDIPEKLFFKKISNGKKGWKLIVNYNNMWKANDIIDFSHFNVIEFILNKPKDYHKLLNSCKNNSKPYLLVVNRAFFTTKITNTSIYKYHKITNKPSFCILDECHSCMSSETYLLLNHIKYNWEAKIHGFSATPYRDGNSKTKAITSTNIDINIINEHNLNTTSNIQKLINIFHKPNNKNKLNILSSFDMKQAIEEGVILEPIFHWYEIKEINEDDARKKDYTYNKTEIHTILKVLNNCKM